MKSLSIYLLLALSIAVPALAAPVGQATYTVTFDATWSATSHPESFPPNPHFSGLVGGSHNAVTEFWSVGQLASLGIKHMAEWGTQTTLVDEVNAEVIQGNAGAAITGDVLWNSPGTVSTEFVVTPDFPLVTLVTMIAPSPDWFAGVQGLDLGVGDQWVNELTVPLYPYDAGTDSGAGYTSADQPTVPAQAISSITGSPFSAGVEVGTLTFRLSAVAATPSARDLSLTAWPNPFNPRTTIEFSLPTTSETVLAVYDIQGSLVRELARGTFTAGSHNVVWDGLDQSQRALPSGTYLYRVVAGTDAERA